MDKSHREKAEPLSRKHPRARARAGIHGRYSKRWVYTKEAIGREGGHFSQGLLTQMLRLAVPFQPVFTVVTMLILISSTLGRTRGLCEIRRPLGDNLLDYI